MRITELLNKKGIDLYGQVKTKQEAINKMVDLMIQTGNIKDPKEYRNRVFAREEEGTTGIGEGIAIPHAKTEAVTRAGLAAMIVKGGVDYDALDGEAVDLIFLIAAPDTEDNIHLDVLSRLSVLLMDGDFTGRLRRAKTADEFLQIIDEAESDKSTGTAGRGQSVREGYRILAVTACPTGIAHTYMAAEGLESKAKEMGVAIKVETDGSGGAKNVLSKEEIESADCIIVAADKNIEMSRFHGKRVLQTKVANGISKPEELIKEALSGNVGVYYEKGDRGTAPSYGEKESAGRRIYKHLMNGVSHMLPFVIGGGILIALAFLFDKYDIDPANFGSNTPFAAFLKSVGDAAFGFMLPVLAGFIAMSIGDRPALAVGFIGGYLAKEGGSGFLGALLAGFIAGYLIVLLKTIFSKLPRSLEGIKPVLLYPILGILGIGAAVIFLVNPPVAAFNSWLTVLLNNMGGTSKALMGLVLGGMMSVDFGGPVNKAAYVFGTAAIESGQYDIMAAVMIGGMVPPLAIALAQVLFKNRFTNKERQSGLTNFIMGLAFITEGAIPFAAADPLRVIPACAIGSAAAGCLSMVFKCTLRAPHGGVFVFPVVGNAMLYVLSLVIGTVIGAVLLGIFKKKRKDN